MKASSTPEKKVKQFISKDMLLLNEYKSGHCTLGAYGNSLLTINEDGSFKIPSCKTKNIDNHKSREPGQTSNKQKLHILDHCVLFIYSHKIHITIIHRKNYTSGWSGNKKLHEDTMTYRTSPRASAMSTWVRLKFLFPEHSRVWVLFLFHVNLLKICFDSLGNYHKFSMLSNLDIYWELIIQCINS